jgi:hypothetical protein
MIQRVMIRMLRLWGWRRGRKFEKSEIIIEVLEIIWKWRIRPIKNLEL